MVVCDCDLTVRLRTFPVFGPIDWEDTPVFLPRLMSQGRVDGDDDDDGQTVFKNPEILNFETSKKFKDVDP